MKPKTHLDGLSDCNLHKRTPYGMTNVSYTQLSVARYSGACRFNGELYAYIHETDELIREDVLKWVMKRDAEERKKANELLQRERSEDGGVVARTDTLWPDTGGES